MPRIRDDGITFDDVLLVPRYSRIVSRRTTDTATRLTPHISLHIPIVSANMDTVTEAAMAITLAREGGIGVIHRFLSIPEHVAQIERVKRSESILIENPYTIAADRPVREAKELMHRHEVGGILVMEGDRLVGILTTRDVLFEDRIERPVHEVMTPRKELVTAPVGTDIAEAKRILQQHRIEKLPLVDARGRLRGLITAQDIVKRQQYPQASKDAKGRLLVGAAIGVRGDYVERAGALVEAGADVLVVDIAHGHSENAVNTVRRIKKRFAGVEIMAGNVATPGGVRDLVEAGADAVKVGIGAGSACITRVVTGAGVPQLTAILDCASAADRLNVPIVADGGIRHSGDIVKALAAGASSVMLGGLFAGTDEAPGFTVMRPKGKYKLVRGMASLGAALDRETRERQMEWDPTVFGDYVPEGVEALVPYQGSVAEVLHRLLAGLRSGMSYCGATTLAELRRRAKFMRITEAGRRESGPHDLEVLE